ncbi:Ribosomal biogenesis protein las1l [Allomyces arbusculus]|nr:Ribosomal biogenesis protein las1l [Allomyces arbusculus]
MTPPASVAARLARIIPWVDDNEWEDVHHWLYAEDPNDRQRGVERVHAWMSRGRVPHSVQATANMVEIALRQESDTLTESELRALYSLAVIRFINGNVDSSQRRHYAQSVSTLANELSIPLWLVDLRHQATHDTLPALVVLMQARETILAWLRDHYWLRQRNVLADTRNELLDHLKVFRKARKDELRSSLSAAAMRQRDAEPVSNAAVARILNETLAGDATTVVQVLIPALVAPGALVPTLERARASFPGDLSSKQFELWMPLLTAVQTAHPCFYEELLFALTDRIAQATRVVDGDQQSGENGNTDALTPSYFASIHSWIKYLLKTVEVDGWWASQVTTPLPATSWVESLLLAPSIYSMSIVEILVRDHFVPAAPIRVLLDAWRAANPRPTKSCKTPTPPPLPSPQTLHHDLHTLELRRAKLTESRKRRQAVALAPPGESISSTMPRTGWRRVNSDYSVYRTDGVPIGLLPSGQPSSLNWTPPPPVPLLNVDHGSDADTASVVGHESRDEAGEHDAVMGDEGEVEIEVDVEGVEDDEQRSDSHLAESDNELLYVDGLGINGWNLDWHREIHIL